MSWRTVIVTGRAKLDKKLGFMVVRSDNCKSYQRACKSQGEIDIL